MKGILRKFFTKKHVIVIGANGQLGSLLKSCAPSEYKVFNFDSKTLDITREPDIQNIIDNLSPDLIINASAYTKVDLAESEQEKAFAVNSTGPELLAKLSPAGTKIIHVSTDFVFDGSADIAYKPTDKPSPVSVYGQSKLEGEEKLLDLRPDSIVIRTSWVYAAVGKNFVNTMLALMENKPELSVVGDQTGTPTSAQTLARVIWLFAQQGKAKGIFHWTDRGQTSWFEFARAIQQKAMQLGLISKEIPLKAISTAQYPTPAKRPMYSVLDKTATYNLLGFEGLPWQEELQAVLKSKAESH